MTEARERIQRLVESDPVVLFMKGTRAAPQCGFSATVVELLDQHLATYVTVDVLADPAIRDGVKEFANWPTIPQLFIRGEFVGGCDIVREMDNRGELATTLRELATTLATPRIAVTDAAATVFRTAVADCGPGEFLRLGIDRGFAHDLGIGPRTAADIEVEANGITLLLDRSSARRADGVTIDYVEAPHSGFKIDNPNAPPSVQLLTAREAKAMLDGEPAAKLLDVRTPEERELAKIAGSIHLGGGNIDDMLALAADTPLVFVCHHGQRSRQAAMHFLERGFRRVYNLQGGIDAWSRDVDPTVPRY